MPLFLALLRLSTWVRTCERQERGGLQALGGRGRLAGRVREDIDGDRCGSFLPERIRHSRRDEQRAHDAGGAWIVVVNTAVPAALGTSA